MKKKRCQKCGNKLGPKKTLYCSYKCGLDSRYTIFIPDTMIDNDDLFNNELLNKIDRIEIARVSLSLRDRDE